MARGKKTGGRDFKPGEGGRPRLPQDIKDARKINQVEFERVVNEFLYMTKAGIRERLEAFDTPTLEHLMGQIILKAIDQGDQLRLDFLLNRTIGRMKEREAEIPPHMAALLFSPNRETLIALSQAARQPMPKPDPETEGDNE
jgi:hypothetical protein